MSMFRIRYRIIMLGVKKTYYLVERRQWWSPFWEREDRVFSCDLKECERFLKEFIEEETRSIVKRL